MHPVEAEEYSNDYVKVARKFVSLYYRVLNDYESYLSRFYGSDSSVVVCEVPEQGEQKTTKADNADMVHQLLSMVYADVAVKVRSCTPQPSSGGCLSLLVTGSMSRRHCSEEMSFTQALILSRQRDGYYIKTDTVLVLPRTSSCERQARFLESVLPSLAPSVSNEDGLEASQMAMFDTIVFDSNTQLSTNENCSRRNHPSSFTTNTGIISQTGFDQEDTNKMNNSEEALCNSNTMPRTSNTQLPCQMNVNGIGSGADSTTSTMCVRRNRSGSSVSAPASSLARNVSTMKHEANDIRDQFQSLLSCSQNSVEGGGVTRNPPTELKSLFACKLPMDVTVEEVTQLFSQFGTLDTETPVKVFTGPTNCYAYVNYLDEESLQNALKGETFLRGVEVVTDEWRPRERTPGRRRRRNTTNENQVVNAN